MKLFGKMNGKTRTWICAFMLVIITSVSVSDHIVGNAAVTSQAAVQDGTGESLDNPEVTPDLGQPEIPVVTPEPSEPEISTAPTGAVEPTAPEVPTAPSGAVEPTEPEIPTGPSEPVNPTAPTGPSEPVNPTAPTGSSEPAKPEEILPVRASVSLQKGKKNAVISWKPAEGDVSYEIYRSSQKNGEYKKIAVKGAGSVKYTDKSVKRGNYYYYRVSAVMENGSRRNSSRLKFGCPVNRVSGVKLIRYSTSSIKVTWNKNKQAACYKVYYSKKKSGKYRLAGTTKNTWYRVSRLGNNQTYYFQVKACAAKKASALDSAPSAAAGITTRSYERTTLFAGDSITTGLASYNILNEINIGGKKNTVAAIGLNTTTFRTRREFGGLSALGKIIATRPYRVYIMIGTNEIHYRSSNDVIAGYREIVQSVRKETPTTDVVLLAVPPVTRSKQQASKGFAAIPDLNNKIKAMAKDLKVRYFDYTHVLKDANGCLQSQYAAGDGIHWTATAYRLFARQIEKYDKSLD